jgi:hypothetical protein
MKKSMIARKNAATHKLSLHSETIRMLTGRELTLVVAGNCLDGSMASQITSTMFAGAC